MTEAPRDGSVQPVFELPDVEAEWVYVVDDDELVLRAIERLVTATGYRVKAFADPTAALDAIQETPPRVLITDLEMPGMTGLELGTKALEQAPGLRVLIATGAGDEETAQATLRLGFADYLRKPVEQRELAGAVQKAFVSLAREEYADDMDAWLRAEVLRRTEDLHEVTLATLESLMAALEARSAHFKGHSQSVAVCAAGIARELELPPPIVRSIRTAGLLHDIGMIAVPDDVVDKPGELDPDEYEAVRSHCGLGADILTPMTHLGPVIRFVYEHHERFDGSGYPDQKMGNEISIGGQVVGLAEVWTALTERRAYREGLSKTMAFATLEGMTDAWFSGELVDALRASEG